MPAGSPEHPSGRPENGLETPDRGKPDEFLELAPEQSITHEQQVQIGLLGGHSGEGVQQHRLVLDGVEPRDVADVSSGRVEIEPSTAGTAVAGRGVAVKLDAVIDDGHRPARESVVDGQPFQAELADPGDGVGLRF